MKVSIKGLVFVGFAAAILSANAMAADNTVTSKSYVDNKFQTKVEGSNNQLVQATGTAGSVKYLTISDSSTDVDTTNGTGKVVSGKAVADAITANNTDLNLSQYEEKANKVDSIDTSLDTSVKQTNYPSQAAVEAYVGSATTVTNFVVDSIVDSVTDRAPSQNAVYDALALKQNASTAVTHTQDSAVGSATVPVYIDSTGAAQPTTLGTAATSNVSTGIADDDTGLTTGDQVHDYVAAQLTDTSLVGNGVFTVSINGTSQTFSANQATSTSISVDGLEVTDNKATAINATNSTSTDAYASTKAVYDYVQGLPSSSLPGVDTTICDSTHPCALVTDTSTGAAKWVRIVQQGD